MKLSSLINNYIPTEKVPEAKERMMDMLMLCLKNVQEDSIKGPIVDNMFPFISSDAHVECACKWLEQGFIHGDDQAKLFALNNNHKYSIVRRLH